MEEEGEATALRRTGRRRRDVTVSRGTRGAQRGQPLPALPRPRTPRCPPVQMGSLESRRIKSRRNRVIWVYREGVFAPEGDFSEGSRRDPGGRGRRRWPTPCRGARGCAGQFSGRGMASSPRRATFPPAHVCEWPQHVPGGSQSCGLEKGGEACHGDPRAVGALEGLPAAGLQGEAGAPGACGPRHGDMAAQSGPVGLGPAPGHDPRPLGFTPVFKGNVATFLSCWDTITLFTSK